MGAPDPYSGEVPAACVVVTANPRATEDDLLAWAKLHAPEPAAAPKAVHIVHALPTTLIGKT
ncbi:AMP-binding enzyme [Actinomadura keratinilytica]|uniref:AMP-binding enzyme n=1 Tax=Actinomadura keratinilytica TaxID=547461 RepID=UPI0031E9DEBD